MNEVTGINEPLYAYLETMFQGTSSSQGTPKNLKHLKVKLRKFANRTGITSYDLDPNNQGGFDRVWLLDFGKSTLNLRSFYLVGANTHTQELEVLKIQSIKGSFKKPEPVTIKYFTQNREELFPVVGQSKEKKQRVASIFDLRNALTHQRERTVSSLQDSFRTAFRSQVDATLGISFLSATKKKATELLDDHLNSVLDAVNDLIDQTAFSWAGDVRENKAIANDYTEFDVYNHMVKAVTLEARGYRYTALQQFSRLGCLFLDAPVWEQIDSGQPPITVLAAHIGVAPATLKRMAKMQDVFEKEGRKGLTETFAPYLDALDPSLWPKTKEDMFHFKICKNVADLHQEFFGKDARAVIARWTKNHKQGVGCSQENYWNKMAFRLLSPQINHMVEKPSERMRFVNKQQKKKILPFINPPFNNADALPGELNKTPQLWHEAVACLKKHIESIKDMKAEISKRLLIPAVLLEFEDRGYRVAEPSLLDNVSHRVSETLWGGMSPTDQIAANAFWHSPQVNITQRFQTAALINSGYQEWPGLLPEDTEIHKGVVLHPLLSNPALQEEGQKMSHCIGSYGSNFFTRNYHFFSVRDALGKRLSSLTVQDFFDGKDRNIRFVENKSISNSAPSKEASGAAQKLIKAINEEDIWPDWEGIDQARGEYRIRQVENAAGYDIRDVERRQAVLDTYWPCVRHSKQRGSGTYDSFVDALDVKTIVSEFLDEFDFSKNGLVRSGQPRTLSNQNNASQQRPMMR